MVKRRTWKRWPSEKTRIVAAKNGYKGKGRTPELTECPVCDARLVSQERVEQGPHGPETVRTLRCPNPACPRPK